MASTNFLFSEDDRCSQGPAATRPSLSSLPQMSGFVGGRVLSGVAEQWGLHLGLAWALGRGPGLHISSRRVKFGRADVCEKGVGKQRGSTELCFALEGAGPAVGREKAPS